VSDETEPPEATIEEQRESLRQERARFHRLRISETGVALAALLVSLTVFMLNGALSLRGSQVALLQPKTALLYRDSGPNGSVLWIAVQASMINAARADYGDIVERAWLSLEPQVGGAEFPYEAIIEPVTMTRDVETAVKNCPNGARCIPGTGFYVVERPEQLIDLPGGASRSAHMAFAIGGPLCGGDQAACARFMSYTAAVDTLRALPDPVIRMSLKMHFDGEKKVECALSRDPQMRKAIFDYLDEKGWAEVACVEDDRRSRRNR
jgi:hypothetical protein